MPAPLEPSESRRAVFLLLHASVARVLQVGRDGAGAEHVAIAMTTRETESAAVPAGSLAETGSARPCLTTSAAPDAGDFVRDGAEDVEEQVIDQQHDPGADDEQA